MERNRNLFDKQMGEVFRVFRTKVLKKTLQDIGGRKLVPSLSNFETGKLFRYDYMFYYVMACENEEQLSQLEYFVSIVMTAAWKRRNDYDQKN